MKMIGSWESMFYWDKTYTYYTHPDLRDSNTLYVSWAYFLLSYIPISQVCRSVRKRFVKNWKILTLFRMGFFGATQGCHTYPTIMKLSTIILYLKKTQKIYGSRWHTPWFLLTSAFSHQKSANFAISENTDRYRLHFGT